MRNKVVALYLSLFSSPFLLRLVFGIPPTIPRYHPTSSGIRRKAVWPIWPLLSLPPRRNPRANTLPAARNCSGLYVGKQPFRPPMQIRLEFDTTRSTLPGEELEHARRFRFATVSNEKTNFSRLIVFVEAAETEIFRSRSSRIASTKHGLSSLFRCTTTPRPMSVYRTNYLSSRRYAALFADNAEPHRGCSCKQKKVNGKLSRDVTSSRKRD